MALNTPDEKTKEETGNGCRIARYLWIIPVATAGLSWLVAEVFEDHLACRCVSSELIAVVVGALIGVSISNALKQHFCHGSKDRLD